MRERNNGSPRPTPSPYAPHASSYCTGGLSFFGWRAVFAVYCYIVAGSIHALIRYEDDANLSQGRHDAWLVIATAIVLLVQSSSGAQVSIFAGRYL